MSSIICSLGVTPDVRRDSCQVVGCGKEVLKYLRNACTGRCVSCVAALASMFYTPVMRLMDAWILAWRVIHAAYRRRGLMAVAVLTLPRRDQLSAAVLSTSVEMCSSGAMRRANRCRWAMYAASSRSLMARNPVGFASVRMWAHMAVLNVSHHKCQLLM